MPRQSHRGNDELRAISLERAVAMHAEGSCLVKFGHTHVLCTASLEERPPAWRRGTGVGWITAEYGMLPRATSERMRREASAGRPSGRTQEIQRLIGRSLRAVVDRAALGERQITVDCDVLQADGGTRTASICGGWVALHDACTALLAEGVIDEHPLVDACAAISVGILAGECRLDLPYEEDSRADVDMNVVMTGSGDLIEVQGTAEGEPFGRAQLDELVDLATAGIGRIVEMQRAALGS
jgi:ribonuclease PH